MTKRDTAARDLRDRFRRAAARHRKRATAESWFELGSLLAEATARTRELARELCTSEGFDDGLQPVACWKKCVALAPRHAVAWQRLGQAYIELDERGQAERALRRAVKLDPRLAEAWNHLAILALPANGEPDLAGVRKAERYLQRAMKADPRGRRLGWEPYAWLAEAAERRRDDPGALAWYAEANRRGDRYAAARSQVIEGHGARRRPAKPGPRPAPARTRRTARGRRA
jgi:tetratricopeptide (TPR) repeat protein